MKKIVLMVCSLALFASLAYGQAWNPTPMVIEVNPTFHYAFDGSNVEIPFSLSGKGGKFYLVIQSKLDDAQKPVAIMNGFRGWHFVNGIDTTMYVSTGRDFTPGISNKFPWDGHGNERQYDSFADSGKIGPGTYSYYITGYDDKSNREMANSFLNGGNSQTPKSYKFYPYDDKTGALLAHPLYMGAGKFTLGDDPYDQSKIVTTFTWGFASGDIIPAKSISKRSIVFNMRDYNTFYVTKYKSWESANTVTKWTFVPLGESIQDVEWGDWDKITEIATESDVAGGIVENDGVGYMVWNLCAKNPVASQVGRLLGFPEDDPTDIMFYVFQDEYYQANPVIDADGVARTDSEAGRVEKGPIPGQYYMCGDDTCLLELLDAHKMMDGADDPFKSDGSGYVVWANSNGDWFGDKNTYAETLDPLQLWACISFEPRNFNNQRQTPNNSWNKDGFNPTWIEFGGLYSVMGRTPDGSGIDYWQFADDSFSSGGDNQQKKQNGSSLDVGSQFDGLYSRKPMMASPAWGDASYNAMTWFGYDVGGGLITSQDVAVEEADPAAFSVAQNTPNPFNPTTTINFSLAKQGQVSVDVFNVAGQKVATLANDVLSAGSHSVTWDSNGFAAGVYFYTVKSGDYTKTMKMTLLK